MSNEQNGHDNIIINGDGNTINSGGGNNRSNDKSRGTDPQRHQPVQLPSKIFRVHSVVVNALFAISIGSMFFTSLIYQPFANSFLIGIITVAIVFSVIWFLLPLKFPSLLTGVYYDHIYYQGSRISYADIYEIKWLHNEVKLKMINGENIQFKFVQMKGLEYLVDAYKIFSKS